MEKDKGKEEDFEQELHEHFSFKIDSGQEPLRIDKFLMSRIENATRNKIQKAAKEGSIRVNDKIVKSSYKVKKNDEIRILLLIHHTKIF
jgi:23S rRNA pseudouridine1911/1915/1917 synthase